MLAHQSACTAPDRAGGRSALRAVAPRAGLSSPSSVGVRATRRLIIRSAAACGALLSSVRERRVQRVERRILFEIRPQQDHGPSSMRPSFRKARSRRHEREERRVLRLDALPGLDASSGLPAASSRSPSRTFARAHPGDAPAPTRDRPWLPRRANAAVAAARARNRSSRSPSDTAAPVTTSIATHRWPSANPSPARRSRADAPSARARTACRRA